jgi:hypothetical protein
VDELQHTGDGSPADDLVVVVRMWRDREHPGPVWARILIPGGDQRPDVTTPVHGAEALLDHLRDLITRFGHSGYRDASATPERRHRDTDPLTLHPRDDPGV